MHLKQLGRLCGKITAMALLGIVIAPLTGNAQQSGSDLTFTTWTGPYMRSQMLGFVRPYEDATGSDVYVEHYAGGINELRDQVESANVVWDVIDLIEADMLRACDEGWLENIENIQLPDGIDGTPFKDDFVDGALHKCGVGFVVWATAFGYDNDAFGDETPSKIADFFDTKNFPGRRAIRNDPTVVMEWALIADGVAQNDVYSILETPEGVERALKVMDSIKPGLQLWNNGLEPVRLLNAGEVVMSSVWATTGVVAAKKTGEKFSIAWDGRVIEVELLGIPKGSQNKQAAMDFIRFATSSNSLARSVEYHPNGPARRSSFALLSDEVTAQLPNNPATEDLVTIQSDAVWWSKNHAALEEAFDNWLADTGQQGASGTVR